MEKTEDIRNYRRIVKATGLFGGVQVINILCSLVKTKLIAVWLGAEGVGLIGLYNTTVDMMTSLTGLGLRNSSVRDITHAVKSGDERKIQETKLVVRRWSWFVGLLGSVVLLTLAPCLSRWTFGNDKYMWGFVILSCTMLLKALTDGEQAILQGSKRLKKLARCSVWGAVAGTVFSLPLYYFFGLDGIVPSLVLYAVSLWTATFLSRDKEPMRSVESLSYKETWLKGRTMASLGIFMTVSGFVTTLFSYLFITYLNYRGGTADVGYYQAGYTLVTRYVGLIFTAMGMEYYPRLSAVSEDKETLSKYVSQQAEISLLILAPLVCIFLICREWIIHLLYTSQFVIIEGYLSWAILGTLFKAVSWSLGFILLAKGVGKLFLITEILSNLTLFALNLGGYHFLGLTGIGISYMAGYFIYMTGMYILCRMKYGIRFNRSFRSVFIIILVLCLGTFISYMFRLNWLMMGITIFVCLYSAIYLKKKIL